MQYILTYPGGTHLGYYLLPFTQDIMVSLVL